MRPEREEGASGHGGMLNMRKSNHKDVRGFSLIEMMVALVAVCVPRDRPEPGASPLRELGALREVQVWLTLAIGAFIAGGALLLVSSKK